MTDKSRKCSFQTKSLINPHKMRNLYFPFLAKGFESTLNLSTSPHNLPVMKTSVLQ